MEMASVFLYKDSNDRLDFGMHGVNTHRIIICVPSKVRTSKLKYED